MCTVVRVPGEWAPINQDLQIKRSAIGEYRSAQEFRPPQMGPVVTSQLGERRLELMRWGMVMSSTGEGNLAALMTNTKAETVAGEPRFRDVWDSSRRCLIIAQGFYMTRKRDKIVYEIGLGCGGAMALAGLWRTWSRPNHVPLRTFTIMTCAANHLVSRFDDRMPVILKPHAWPAWLGETGASDKDLWSLLKAYPSEQMAIRQNRRVAVGREAVSKCA